MSDSSHVEGPLPVPIESKPAEPSNADGGLISQTHPINEITKYYTSRGTYIVYSPSKCQIITTLTTTPGQTIENLFAVNSNIMNTGNSFTNPRLIQTPNGSYDWQVQIASCNK